MNTIDLYGDVTALRMILDDTLDVFEDNVMEEFDSNAFYFHTSLTTLSLPNVTSFYGSFNYCPKLSSVSLPKVQYMDATFSSCNIESVSFPELAEVSYYRYTFQDCSKLSSVSLPKLNGTAQYMFSSCSSLAVLELPSLTFIGTGCFKNCTSLTSLTLGRESSICTIYSTSTFDNTPIASGTGHVYVPTSLYSQYITATNWANFASSITTISS